MIEIIIYGEYGEKRVFIQESFIEMLKSAHKERMLQGVCNSILLGGFTYTDENGEGGYCYLQLTNKIILFDTKEVLF